MQPELARMRIAMLEAACEAGHAHLPSAFSILELVYVLHNHVMHHGDVFVLSKGHGVLAQYAVLGMLDEYASNRLPGHPERSSKIKATTGSLGHGLGIAAGIALAKRMNGDHAQVYCIVGDQELREGSVYEAARLIWQMNLYVTIVVDNNSVRLQTIYHCFPSDLFQTVIINGHIFLSMQDNAIWGNQLIIAQTQKGYGVRAMETDPGAWHHRAPTPQETDEFINEITINYLS